MPQSPGVVVERLSEGHQPGQLPARLDNAPVLGGAIAGLAARVLAGHASSAAIMQGGEPGADTDPAVWSRARLMPPALPFAIIAAIGVSRIVAGHAPDDDMALLVIYRGGALTVRRRRRDSRQRPDSGPGPVAALTTMLDQVIAWSRRSPRCGRRPWRSEPVAGSAGPLA